MIFLQGAFAHVRFPYNCLKSFVRKNEQLYSFLSLYEVQDESSATIQTWTLNSCTPFGPSYHPSQFQGQLQWRPWHGQFFLPLLQTNNFFHALSFFFSHFGKHFGEKSRRWYFLTILEAYFSHFVHITRCSHAHFVSILLFQCMIST